jgi:hypothetical protein
MLYVSEIFSMVSLKHYTLLSPPIADLLILRPKVLQKKLPARSPNAPSVPTLSSRQSAATK